MTSGLTVDLSNKSYPIHFVQNATDELQKLLAVFVREGRSSAVVTDEGVARAQEKFLVQNFKGVPQLAVVVGEKAKTIEVFGDVQDFLASQRVGRQSVLWVVGGGVPGDLGGF